MKYVPTLYLKLMIKEMPICKEATYILNNDVYLYKGFSIWEKRNHKKLNNETIVEACEIADKHNQKIVICWTGSLQHRREQLEKYLGCEIVAAEE